MQPRSLVAFNTATASTNKIHDDDTARRFGFRGGLVPGVDVYAYLTHPPAAEWGLDWLAKGRMHARFERPVYDGDAISITPVGDGGLELHDSGGELCAVATATPPAEPPAVDLDTWPERPQATDPPPAAPEVLTPGTVFGLAPHRFHAEVAAQTYLHEARETLDLYTREGVAHPGWVLRDANYVLSANVRLGPWIHVESDVQHLGLVHDGEQLSARAVVVDERERKGHRFVTLDVLHLAEERPVARTTHTAIYRPRGA